MKIVKTSIVSGITHEMEIPSLTPEQLNEYQKGTKSIQDVLPHLNADEREFLMTGITPEEWEDIFKETVN